MKHCFEFAFCSLKPITVTTIQSHDQIYTLKNSSKWSPWLLIFMTISHESFFPSNNNSLYLLHTGNVALRVYFNLIIQVKVNTEERQMDGQFTQKSQIIIIFKIYCFNYRAYSGQ